MNRCHDYLRVAVLALAVGILGGCANEPLRLPVMPEESALADAEAKLREADATGAGETAPELLRQARRRLVNARGILYEASAASREPTEAELLRVRRLADEAWLDARLAIARTREAEVAARLAEAEAELAAPKTEARP